MNKEAIKIALFNAFNLSDSRMDMYLTSLLLTGYQDEILIETIKKLGVWYEKQPANFKQLPTVDRIKSFYKTLKKESSIEQETSQYTCFYCNNIGTITALIDSAKSFITPSGKRTSFVPKDQKPYPSKNLILTGLLCGCSQTYKVVKKPDDYGTREERQYAVKGFGRTFEAAEEFVRKCEALGGSDIYEEEAAL